MAVMPCGFKSRHSHQTNKNALRSRAFLFVAMASVCRKAAHKSSLPIVFARISLMKIRFRFAKHAKTTQDCAPILDCSCRKSFCWISRFTRNEKRAELMLCKRKFLPKIFSSGLHFAKHTKTIWDTRLYKPLKICYNTIVIYNSARWENAKTVFK